jgi:hypothetical protein
MMVTGLQETAAVTKGVQGQHNFLFFVILSNWLLLVGLQMMTSLGVGLQKTAAVRKDNSGFTRAPRFEN